MHDFIVVGGGLFGRIISRALSSKGASVAVVDDGRPLSGSKAAACLMKPGWASSMTTQEYDSAVGLIQDLYGPIVDISLRVRGTPKSVTVHWTNPADILRGGGTDDIAGRAEKISDKTVILSNGRELQARKAVIICTGSWVKELLPQYSETLTPKGGWAFTWSGQIAEPFLRLWAPYRQIIGFNRGPDEIWCGDGSALSMKTFHDCGSMHKSLARCVEALGPHADPARGPRITAGLRPYMVGRKAPALFEEVQPGLYVASGGGKNGTLGAAWSAQRLLERYA